MFPYIIQNNQITVVIDNQPHSITSGHLGYDKLKAALKSQAWDEVRDLVCPRKIIANYSHGTVKIDGDTLTWAGHPMHNSLATRMIAMYNEGFSIEPLIAFMDNLMQNPSKRAVEELYSFLECNSLPITEDGYFLAYKKVRSDYMDIYSGTVLNAPPDVLRSTNPVLPFTTAKGVTSALSASGELVNSMPRNFVDDNKDNTCSEGLHFCSQGYLDHFGGSDSRIVVLKINPRDVVSIPSDCNNSKGRCSLYTVIGEIKHEKSKINTAFTAPVQTNANDVVNASQRGDNDRIELHIEETPWEVKTGSTDFYRGYTDGFNGVTTSSGTKNYNEGYDKGAMHATHQMGERYRYVAPAVILPVAVKTAPTTFSKWPLPVNK